MREINTNNFIEATFDIVDTLKTKESENIKKAAKICSDAIMEDGVIQVFGSGHSVGFATEMQGRAGSLVPVHTIESIDFVKSRMYTYEDYRDMDNIFERRPGIAGKFYELYDIRKQDVFIIISNSGINGLVIDLAIEAKKNNQKIIVVTSLDHTLSEDSRHPSGKKLKDFADVVIDNCGPKGDALLEIESGAKIGSVSSVLGIYIAQGLVVQIVENLQKAKANVPILFEEDSEEAIKHNKELLEKYKGRI